jgi:hypothetical protein
MEFMNALPLHLRYGLGRGQRLVPLVRSEGIGATVLAVGMVIFFIMAAVMNGRAGKVEDVFGFAAFAAGVVLLYRRLFAGLLEVVMVAVRWEDLMVEESGMGMVIGGERWWFFLEGIREIRKWRRDLWTLRHAHGWMLHIPAGLMNEDLLDHIRRAVERGGTAEGTRLMVERGRRIEEMMRDEGMKT